MKKHVLLAVLMLLPLMASADAVEIDGLYYNLDSENKTAEVTRSQNGYSGEISIPNQVTYENENYRVSSIAMNSFISCFNLTSLTIPQSVTFIDNRAFNTLFNLVSIVVDAENTVYDSRNNCNAIIETASNQLVVGCKNTIIPNNVTSIGDFAFLQNSSLEAIDIPTSVSKIGNQAFYGCSSLESLFIPSSVMSIGFQAFRGCTKLSSVIVDGNNPKYDSRENCNAIIETATSKLIVGCKNSFIPSSVAVIGDYAFYNCYGIASLAIPNSVISVGEGAFDNTDWYYNTHPDGLVYAGRVAYKYKGTMSANTSIVIDQGTTEISPSAFSGCSGLTSISIPNSVMSIGNNAFRDCKGLLSVVLPSVSMVGTRAFQNCIKMESVTLSSNTNNISSYAFQGCTGLKDIICNAINVPATGNNIFDGVPLNANLFVPQANINAYLTANQWNRFSQIAAIESTRRTITVTTAGTLPTLISDQDKYLIKELYLDGEINGTDLKLLRDMAGNNYQGEITEGKLKILDLSGARIVEGGDPYIEASSIKTTVGATMFPIYGSKYSTSTDVITYYMFAGCNFQSINLPAAITSIRFCAFAYCVNLESISIPDKVTYLETSAFEGCRKLASIWIPKSVSTLYGSSLDGGSLTSIVVEDGNPKYDSRDNCNAVIETENNKLIIGCKASTIPNTVTSIGMQAFFACQLTSITIPSSVNTIEYGAFGESTITSIIIPSTVTSIGINIFSRCKQLTSIVVEKGNPNYDSRDNSNAIIETATNKLIATCNNTIVPSSVTELGEYTFSQWKELPSDLLKYIKTICANAFDNALFASIVIPEGVESIGKEAFRNCNVMKTISLPASLKTIGDNVFSSCYNMIEIYSHNSNPSDISEKVFNYQIWDSSTHKYVPFSSKATLYVPAGTKEKYQAAEGWKEFTNIVEMETKGFAVFDPATGTLTFKYGDYMPGDNVYETDETHFDGTWDCSKIKKVVFDPSFANARPQSTAFWFYEAKSLTEIEDIQYLNTSNVTNMYCMFYECSSLTSLDVSHFDTSNVINMEAMFCRCSSLTSLDVSHFNTSNVTSMGGMFDGCSGLTSLDVSNFKTDNVIYIGGMFHYCSGLTNLDVSNFDTGNVTDMSSMFECCSSLTGLDVSNFNTNNVTDMRHMFSSCEGLTVLDVSNFDTGNVADMSYMFQSCVGLTNIDISSFDTKNVTDISGMFNFCNALTTILVSEKWSTANVTSCEDMFKNCNKLVGGKGTVYDAEHIDAAYARIDGGADTPGYFTEKVTVNITIGKSGKASYCGDKSLDFSFSDEIKAYIATGFDKDAEIIWLTRVKDVPAGTPVLIKGEANKTYDVPVTDTKNSYYENLFKGNTSGATVQVNETEGDMVNYYLSGDGTFKSVKGYVNIGNNKSYLQLPGTFAPAEAGATQTVKVGSAGKGSYAAPVDLDFTNVDGLKAFTATGYDKSSKTIWLTRVMKVQKGEGVLLKGDAKDYEIPSVAVQSSYMNMFVGNTSGASVQVQATSADGSKTNFYLKGDGTFVSVNGYVNIGNNKCYLELPTDMVSGAASTRGAEANYILEEPEVIKLPISFRSLDNDGNGTTAIREAKQSKEDGAYYTLQGQRVVNPGKGLFIKNGCKIIIR